MKLSSGKGWSSTSSLSFIIINPCPSVWPYPWLCLQFEDFGREAKTFTSPDTFEGGKLEITRHISGKSWMTHILSMGESQAPAGYQLHGTFVWEKFNAVFRTHADNAGQRTLSIASEKSWKDSVDPKGKSGWAAKVSAVLQSPSFAGVRTHEKLKHAKGIFLSLALTLPHILSHSLSLPRPLFHPSPLSLLFPWHE